MFVKLCIRLKVKADKQKRRSSASYNKLTHRHLRRCHPHRPRQNPSLAFSTMKQVISSLEKPFRKYQDTFNPMISLNNFSSVAKWIQRTRWRTYQSRLLPRHQARRSFHRRTVVLLLFIIWFLHTYEVNSLLVTASCCMKDCSVTDSLFLIDCGR